MATIKTRYGYTQPVNDPEDVWITRKLIAELRSEQFDEPVVTSHPPETMHLRDIPDAQLVRIWQAVVRGDEGALLEHPWKPLSGLPPYVRDFYRVGA